MVFRNCKNLSCVSVPKTLKDLGFQTFTLCSDKLTFYGEGNNFKIYFGEKDFDYEYKVLALYKKMDHVSVGESIEARIRSFAKCEWKSSNKSFATVNSTGKVTGKKKGGSNNYSIII